MERNLNHRAHRCVQHCTYIDLGRPPARAAPLAHPPLPPAPRPDMAAYWRDAQRRLAGLVLSGAAHRAGQRGGTCGRPVSGAPAAPHPPPTVVCAVRSISETLPAACGARWHSNVPEAAVYRCALAPPAAPQLCILHCCCLCSACQAVANAAMELSSTTTCACAAAHPAGCTLCPALSPPLQPCRLNRCLPPCSGPSSPSPKRVTLRTLRDKYVRGEPISMVTAYDYPSAVHVRSVAD